MELATKKDIQEYLNQGYHVLSDGGEYITLRKLRKFDTLGFVILLFLGMIPGLIYLVYYITHSEKTITLNKVNLRR